MKQIRSWMSHHPFKVVLFTFLFTLIPALMAVTNERFFYVGLSAFMFFVIVWAITVWRYSKNIVTVLLITVIMAAPLKQAKAAMVGVGVIVICVGSYCVYKVVKVCQKKFPPKDTNAPPAEFTAASSEYGGAYEYSSIGSCYQPSLLNASPYENLLINPTTFTLNVMVEPAGVTTSMSVNNAEGTAQDWTTFQAEMATHGLFITGHPGGQPQFEMGGVPCDPSMVPLEFDPLTGRVTHHTSGDMRRVIVERSLNLVDWTPLLVTDTGVGNGFKVVDTTREGQMFYRVQVTQP
jgi:hypothetical protein